MAWSRSALPSSFAVLALLTSGGAKASQLKPRTAEAFQHYEELTEARIQSELSHLEQFLFLDSLPEKQREEQVARLKNGQVYIQPLVTRENNKKIEIHDGLAHHWIAVGFIPKARLEQVLEVARDFDHHAEYFKPDVQRSKLLSRDDEHFRVYLRLYRHTIVTVTYNTEFDVQYSQSDPTHQYCFMRAVRIAEVRNAGEKEEREYPVGNDHGFLWRLNFYTRYVEADGGVYVQIELLSLSRTVPVIIAWLVNPYLKSIPREYLTGYFAQLKKAVNAKAGETEPPAPPKE